MYSMFNRIGTSPKPFVSSWIIIVKNSKNLHGLGDFENVDITKHFNKLGEDVLMRTNGVFDQCAKGNESLIGEECNTIV